MHLLCFLVCFFFFINLNLAESLESPQSQVKVKSPRRDGDSKIRVSPVSKEAINLDGGQENLEAKSLTGGKMSTDVLVSVACFNSLTLSPAPPRSLLLSLSLFPPPALPSLFSV